MHLKRRPRRLHTDLPGPRLLTIGRGRGITRIGAQIFILSVCHVVKDLYDN
jgi:hypothetical protein